MQGRQTLASMMGYKITEGMGYDLNPTFRSNPKIVASEHGRDLLLGTQAETFAN